MYGMEMSVLLPLLGEVGGACRRGRSFPATSRGCTAPQVQAPRLLVTTPVHLRALVESGVALPPMPAIVSATAPLPVGAGGRRPKQRFGCEVLRSVRFDRNLRDRAPPHRAWKRRGRCMPGVHLHPQPDGTVVHAPHLAAPVALADIVELSDGGRRFRLRGRHADLLEIAGKRASLGDLTRQLLAMPGVRDGVVFQLDDGDALGVHRIAALAVAPELDEAMRSSMRCVARSIRCSCRAR